MNKMNPYFTRPQFAIILFLLAIGLIGLGISANKIIANKPNPDGLEFKEIKSESTLSAAASSVRPMVHVAGKVKKPGVYTLSPNSRKIHAIQAAGGFLPNADTDAINLAEPVKDGEQIYVPSKDQTRPDMSIGSPTTSKSQTSKSAAHISVPALRATKTSASSSGKLRLPGEGYVNINTADEIELQRLPGVGPATAKKIISYRTTFGRFKSPEQLMDVKGIGPKKFQKMQPFVRI